MYVCMYSSILHSPPPPFFSVDISHDMPIPNSINQSINQSCLRLTLRRRIILIKLQTDTIDTMSLVCRGWIAFSLENMTQMTPAIATYDFCPLHSRASICMASHSAGEAVKVRGPTASRFEFVRSLVQRCVAASACVDSAAGKVVVV